MDIRRSINTRIWSDDWFETLKPTEKLIWFYLLTNAQTNMLGIYEVSIKRISFETGLKSADILNAFKAFERVKKAFYWFGWIVLPNWMKNQSLNTNMLTSASRLFELLPNELIIKLKDNDFESFESLLKGCQTLPKIEKEKEDEIKKENLAESLGWDKDIDLGKGLKKSYPKLFQMKSPLRHDEHIKLVNKYTTEKVKVVYMAMQNRPDLTKKYESAYLTANNWLNRDIK